MNPNLFLKSVIAAVLTRTGITRRRLERESRGKAGILMYHRILPSDGIRPEIEPGMYVCNDTFERHLGLLKENFSIVPLEQILKPGAGRGQSDIKPMCSLTFDDGWVDFYTYAYPVLKAHRVPATVFLPTDFIGTNRWFWTDRLGSLLLRQPATGAAAMPKQPQDTAVDKILGLPGSLEARLEAAISYLKAFPLEDIEHILLAMASALKADPLPAERAFLTWAEVGEMAASGLVSFGSHTAGHSILTTIGENAIRQELQASREKLLAEKIVCPDSIPFCYPNGNFNPDIARLVREAGYSLAVGTQYGWNGDNTDIFALKRIPIHNDMTATPGMFLCRMAGIF